MDTNNSINNSLPDGSSVVGEFIQTGGGFNAGNDASDHGINIGGGANAGRPIAIGNNIGETSLQILIGDTGNAKFIVSVPAGDNIGMEMDPMGTLTLPKQCGFLYFYTDTATDVTGNYTEYALKPDNGENIGLGGYDPSNGVFTAPVSGRYLFCINANYGSIGTLHNDLSFYVLSGGNYHYLAQLNPFPITSSGNYYLNLSFYIFLGASDTVSFLTNVGDSTKTVDMLGGTYYSAIYGQLLA